MNGEQKIPMKYGGRIEPIVDGKYDVKGPIGSGGSANAYIARIVKKNKAQVLEALKQKREPIIRRVMREKLGKRISEPALLEKKVEQAVRDNLHDIEKDFNKQNFVVLKVTEIDKRKPLPGQETKHKQEMDEVKMGIEREASLIALPKNDNNAQIYDYGMTAKGDYYIAVEFVPESFPAKALPLEESVEAMIQAGRGIQALHDFEIVHRDIKPENMLIQVTARTIGDQEKFDKEWNDVQLEYKKINEELEGQLMVLGINDAEEKLKIQAQIYEKDSEKIALGKKLAQTYGIKVVSVKNCDYNIVRKMNPTSSDKVTEDPNKIRGTLHYMAPDTISHGVYDVKTDVYSLCASLYNMITGQDLFVGETDEQLSLNTVLKHPVDPRKFNRYVDKDLAIILAKGLHKNPALRYKNVAELVEDLEIWKENNALRFYQFYKKKPLYRKNRVDEVFTTVIDPSKRGMSLVKRVTQTVAILGRTYEGAKEAAYHGLDKKPVMRFLAKAAVKAFPYILGGALTLGVYSAWQWANSAAKETNNSVKTQVETEK
jgi:serine/threonine protein kinase